MLVLSRKPGERVIIGENIEVVVLETRSGCVRLGFIAPQEVRIHREEVRRRVQSGPYSPLRNRPQSAAYTKRA